MFSLPYMHWCLWSLSPLECVALHVIAEQTADTRSEITTVLLFDRLTPLQVASISPPVAAGGF